MAGQWDERYGSDRPYTGSRSRFDGEPVDGIEFGPTKKSISETMEEIAEAIGDAPERPGVFYIKWGDKHSHPCVRLRVELRPGFGKTLRFVPEVDFSLPQGASPEEADTFSNWAREASDKALAAMRVTEGREWTLQEASSYYEKEG